MSTGYFRILTFGQVGKIAPKKVYRTWDECKAALERLHDRVRRNQYYAGGTIRGVGFPTRRAAVEADISNYTQYGGRHCG